MESLVLQAAIAPLGSFDLRLFYVLLTLMMLDVASGLLKAYQQRNINSTVMRDGLVRKGQMLLLLCGIALLEWYAWESHTAAKTFTVMCCLAELRSIAENAAQAGFDVREWIKTRFGSKDGTHSTENPKRD